MKYHIYKVFLRVLTWLVFVKRGLFWLGSRLGVVITKLNNIYKKHIGFYVYKFGYTLKKKFEASNISLKGRLIDVLSRRIILQLAVLTVFFVSVLPHSQLLASDDPGIPGRETILYAMIGPGDQDFADAVVIAPSAVAIRAGSETVADGSVSRSDMQAALDNTTIAPQDLTSITSGGSALQKPTILPGNEEQIIEQQQPSVSDSDRRDVIIHTVQAGDTPGGIAQQYDIDLLTLYSANNLTSRSYIVPGQNLRILPVSGVMHTVRSGDTVSRIARTYNAEVDDIISFNRLQNDGADIVVGEDLVIPGGTPERTAAVVQSQAPSVSVTTPIPKPQVPQTPSSQTPAGSGYIWPSTVRYVSQYYHWRHGAVDIAGAAGSPIYAVKSGTIVTSENGSGNSCEWNYGFGCYVVIDHGGGIQTLYAHMLPGTLPFAPGDRVSQGDGIGLMGSTGNSTGPHVHFEIRINGVKQNPLSYIR